MPHGRGVPLAVAFLSIVAIAATIVAQGALFLLGVPLGRVTLLVGVVLTVALAWWLLPSGRPRVVAAFVVAGAVMLAMAVQVGAWDNTNDSLTYHVPAIIELADGANPVHGELENFWANHHPKGAWVLSAAVYSWTGEIESTRIINVLGVLTAWGMALLFMRGIDGLSTRMAWLLALLVAFNPVTLVQLDTHYVDGLFSSMAVVLVLLAIAANAREIDLAVPKEPLLAIAVAAAVVLANLKFTGLVFVVAIAGAHVVRRLIARRSILGSGRKAVLIAVALCAVSILIAGASPYVTNTVRYGHPLYPLFGADMSTIPDAPDERQRPEPYRGKPAPVAWVMSLTEATSVATQETMTAPYRMKNPVSVQRSELIALEFPDARRGGFGPLFFLALLLSIAALVSGRFGPESGEDGMKGTTIAFGLLGVTALTLVMIEAWWARLAPVFFVAPILVAAWALSGAGGLRRPSRALATAVVIVLAVNSFAITGMQAFNHRNQRAARTASLAQLQGVDSATIRFPDPDVAQRYSLALTRRLTDQGIKVTVADFDPMQIEGWRDDTALYAQIATE